MSQDKPTGLKFHEFGRVYDPMYEVYSEDTGEALGRHQDLESAKAFCESRWGKCLFDGDESKEICVYTAGGYQELVATIKFY